MNYHAISRVLFPVCLGFGFFFCFTAWKCTQEVLLAEDCTDGIDNDRDGWMDGEDPDCVRELNPEISLDSILYHSDSTFKEISGSVQGADSIRILLNRIPIGIFPVEPTENRWSYSLNSLRTGENVLTIIATRTGLSDTASAAIVYQLPPAIIDTTKIISTSNN